MAFLFIESNYDMDWFLDIDDCCGCSACEQICPKGCIKMTSDENGFQIPEKTIDLCINCGLCERVCPIKSEIIKTEQPVKTYMFRVESQEVLESCSSGGAFYRLAYAVILEGGIVFGVKFDKDWYATYGYAESLEQMKMFLGSKYIAPRLNDVYKSVKWFLEHGRMVLFSGIPCHVAGLKTYLSKNYDNLLLVEIICHAVPSPLVWNRYLREIAPQGASRVSFRCKDFGWNRYGLEIMHGDEYCIHEPNDENIYMQAFFHGLSVRNSCGNCAFKCFRTGCDLMIGDFWELEKCYPDLFDNKGMSAVFVFTKKGLNAIEKIFNQNIFLQEIPLSQINLSGEHSTLVKSINLHYYRERFFEQLREKNVSVSSLMKKYIDKNRPKSLKEDVVLIAKAFMGKGYYKFRKLWERK